MTISRFTSGLHHTDLVIKSLKSALSPMLLASLSSALAFACLGAYFYESQKSAYVPYLITVDKQGSLLTAGEITQEPDIPDEVIASQLCDFIVNLRSVYGDKELQIASIRKVYANLNPRSDAVSYVDDFYVANDPANQNNSRRVKVQIENFIRLSSASAQIDWIESDTVHNLGDARLFRGIIAFNLAAAARHSLDELRLNPIGMFINSLHIAERINFSKE